MKKVFLMLSTISLLTLASCSKSIPEITREEPIEELSECLVTNSDYLTNLGTEINSYKRFFSYNEKQKVTRIDFHTLKSTEFATITYEKNKITMNFELIYDGEKETEQLVYTLDAQGRIASYPDDYLQTVSNVTYNSDGYLSMIKKQYTDPETNNATTETQTFTYTAGNLTHVVFERAAAGVIEKTSSTITYGTDELSNDIVAGKVFDAVLHDDVNEILVSFFGKKSKNLATKVISVYTHSENSVNTIESFEFNYQKDAKGNIISIKDKQTSVSGSNSYEFNHEEKLTFECK
ncbi:hypothetical protein QG516_10900 [Pedobacter gandavensis]|uniref:hypothetical protein n=1 Tax=Pedobacter gandavensis TaxID=2679963 RepID=UPI0024789573|nr:hypothetical protein [Pedobacter gandavensis]WGQ12144.1 hypothetical protein QG516_10900 [Pedobacter gandavensis]